MLTLPADTWNQRHGIACPGCQIGEFYGLPTHERHCLEQDQWYVWPASMTQTLLTLYALSRTVDPGLTTRSPRTYTQRQSLRGLHWLVRAAWHVAQGGG